MGFRFRRRVRLFPGFSLNLGKSGITSVSTGTRGVHYTVGRRGARVTAGLPGTGLTYSVTPHVHRRRRQQRRHISIVGVFFGRFLLYVLFRVLAGV